MPSKNKKSKPVKPDHGVRTRAGQLLSQYMREIANEETELIKDPKSGEDRMASKAEALARSIWKDALGYSETKTDKEGNRVVLLHTPNKASQCLVFDRVEGKAPASAGEGAGKLTAAERVTEQVQKRIGKAGKLND